MPMIIGEDKIKDIYVGDNKIAKIYKSNELVYTSKIKKPSRLPEGYTEVEYIEINSTGSVLDLTDRSIRSNAKFHGVFSISNEYEYSSYLLNSGILSCTKYNTSYIILGISSDTDIRAQCGTTSNIVLLEYSDLERPVIFTFALDLTLSTKHLYLSYGDQISEEYKSEKAVWGNTLTRSIRLGKPDSSISSGNAAEGCRIHYLKSECTTSGSNYNWELIPCIQDSDGQVGMYDIKNKKSFLASSVYFTAGPAV